jgi:hypothetical protein
VASAEGGAREPMSAGGAWGSGTGQKNFESFKSTNWLPGADFSYTYFRGIFCGKISLKKCLGKLEFFGKTVLKNQSPSKFRVKFHGK